MVACIVYIVCNKIQWVTRSDSRFRSVLNIWATPWPCTRWWPACGWWWWRWCSPAPARAASTWAPTSPPSTQASSRGQHWSALVSTTALVTIYRTLGKETFTGDQDDKHRSDWSMGSLDILPCNSTHPCTLAEGDCDHDDQVRAVSNIILHNPSLVAVHHGLVWPQQLCGLQPVSIPSSCITWLTI